MRIWAVLSDISSLLKNTLTYLRRRKKRRLYQQWVEQSGLPPGAIPQEEVAEERILKIDKQQLLLTILYILLGACLVILFVGLILLIIYSC